MTREEGEGGRGEDLRDLSATTLSWFRPEKFTEKGSEEASINAYVDEIRLYVPTAKIQAELKDLLAKLKQELVDLINRDYDDFVNLSTNLVDVNSSVDRIREPLQELRTSLSAKKILVDEELASLEDGLRQRSQIGKAKATLVLVQDTTNVVSKVEKLLSDMITDQNATSSSSNDDEDDVPKEKINSGDTILTEEQVDTRSQQLERISSEYSRLKYYLSKGEGLAFLANLEGQLKALDSKFFNLLDSCARSAFERRHMPTIQRCINAYNSVGSPKQAEKAFQHAIIRPIISKVLLSSNSNSNSNSQSQSQQSGNSNSIEKVYEQILKDVEDQAGEIIENINRQLSNYNVCNIAVAIVAEADMAISASRPNIYSPGIPDAFRTNYLASISFLKKLAVYCPSGSLQEFQDSQAVQTFLKRWNLTVYHSLRFQDIAGTFEKHIAEKEAKVEEQEQGSPCYHLSATQILSECLFKCFSDKVFLPSLANKFCRLSYQLLSRYHVWLKAGLTKRKDFAAKSEAANQSQSQKQNTKENFWTKLSVSELVMIVNDLKLLSTKVSVELKQTMKTAMTDLDNPLFEMAFGVIEESVREINSVSSIIKDILGGDVLQQCIDLLKHVRGITATYRMTNRPMPSRPSHYVSSILKPLVELQQSFSKSNSVSDELMTELRDYVVKEVTLKYDETAEDLLRTVKQTESSLKKLKQRQAQTSTGGSQEKDATASDADKICLQLFLDVQEYGKQLCKLGMNVGKESTPEYHHLWLTVAPEDQKEMTL